MATSGVYTFSVTRDDIIKAALRTVGRLGEGATPSTEDYTNCSQALNILVKALVTDGAVLWGFATVSFTTVASQASWSIAASGGDVTLAYVPPRVFQAVLRDSSNKDVTLWQISKQEFDLYSDKTSASQPNMFYYEPGLAAGTVYLLPRPSDATHTVRLTVQRPFQDMAASADTFDFPQEWYQVLKWGLADEIALEYGAPAAVVAMVAGKAEMLRRKMGGWSQEEATTFFTPFNGGWGHGPR